MRESYLDQVIRRGNELELLERAAASRPAGLSAAVRWAVATALGLLALLYPSISAAQALLYIA